MDINAVQWTYINIAKALFWSSPSMFFFMAELWSVLTDPDLKMVCEFLFYISAIVINVRFNSHNSIL